MSLRVCSLASGSSGNATFISSKTTSILIDCGCSAREVVGRLHTIRVSPSDLDAILISHAHVDHYRSAGTMGCRYGIPVYVDPSAASSLVHRGRHTSWKRLAETRPLPSRIGDLDIEVIDTDHGQPDVVGRTVGFIVGHSKRTVGVITDLGHISDAMTKRLRRLSAILIEANYDERIIRRKLADPAFASDWPYLSWVISDRGHLSNDQCADLLSEIVCSKEVHVLLGHMSLNHADPRQDNNALSTVFETIRAAFTKRDLSPPTLHPTYRIGRDPTSPSALLEI